MKTATSSLALSQTIHSWKYPLLSWRGKLREKLPPYLAESIMSGLHTQHDASTVWAGAIHENAWESNFFGKPSFRIDPFFSNSSLDPDDLAGGIRLIESMINDLPKNAHLAVSVDSADSASVQALTRAGFFLADSICCYLLDLQAAQSKLSKHESVRPAVEADVAPLFEVSARCFGDREFNINRFNSDLWYPPSLVANMYGLWLENSITGKLADYVAVFEEDGQPLGFATAKLPGPLEVQHGIKVGSIVLNAVHPEHHNKGIYKAAVQDCLLWMKEKGMEFAEIRTQLPNTGVHRVWQKLGATLVFTLHTFHHVHA